MKAYPAYKNAKLPWLDRIPADWEVLPNIALFDERIERGLEQHRRATSLIAPGRPDLTQRA
jgi:hypothetical protein